MRQNTTRQKTSSRETAPAPELIRALAYVGLFTRIAKRESLSVSHVVQAAKGKRISKKVIQAIIREVHRIEKESGRAA
jgi:hypothetical protein